MLVTLITKEKCTSITLPTKKEGQYWLNNLISMEGLGEEWILKSNRKVSILSQNEIVRSIPLKPLEIYHIKKEILN